MARKKPAAVAVDSPVERAQREFATVWACLGRWCGRDARYAMQHIKVDGPLMWATDGRGLLRVELKRTFLGDGIYDPTLGAKRLAAGLLPEGVAEGREAGWFPPVAEIWGRIDRDYSSGTTVPLLVALDPVYLEEIGKTGKALVKGCAASGCMPVILRTPREGDRSWSRENPNRVAVDAISAEFSIPFDTEMLLSVRALAMPVLLGDADAETRMQVANVPAKVTDGPNASE